MTQALSLVCGCGLLAFGIVTGDLSYRIGKHSWSFGTSIAKTSRNTSDANKVVAATVGGAFAGVGQIASLSLLTTSILSTTTGLILLGRNRYVLTLYSYAKNKIFR